MKLFPTILRTVLCLLLLAGAGGADSPESSSTIGVGELHRLLTPHLPQKPPRNRHALEVVERTVSLGPAGPSVLISLPGFNTYGCSECHSSEAIQEAAAIRLALVQGRLNTLMPGIGQVPLRQYIIQPWVDELLAPHQFAHATFDAIHVFPGTAIIDDKVYDNNTHLHEILHLTQPFVGIANELEAYGLNIRSDPRFLMLNYPYFADVVQAFFVPDLPAMLNEFYARPVQEKMNVPREVQWFMDPFDENSLARIRKSVENLEPLLLEVSRVNRNQPAEAAYLTRQTGVYSLLLDLAAAKMLSLPPLNSDPALQEKAFAIFELQINKTDNTRLGYRIDRKKESLMTLQYQLKIGDPMERLRLYYHFLNRRYITNGELRLQVADPEDFDAFVARKVEGLKKMKEFPGLTEIERQAADELIQNLASRP